MTGEHSAVSARGEAASEGGSGQQRKIAQPLATVRKKEGEDQLDPCPPSAHRTKLPDDRRPIIWSHPYLLIPSAWWPSL